MISPRARRSASVRNERQTNHPKPSGSANTIVSMTKMLVFSPSASEPFWEATASLQLSQAKPVRAPRITAPPITARRTPRASQLWKSGRDGMPLILPSPAD